VAAWANIGKPRNASRSAGNRGELLVASVASPGHHKFPSYMVCATSLACKVKILAEQSKHGSRPSRPRLPPLAVKRKLLADERKTAGAEIVTIRAPDWGRRGLL
jgi:hypothetical protein